MKKAPKLSSNSPDECRPPEAFLDKVGYLGRHLQKNAYFCAVSADGVRIIPAKKRGNRSYAHYQEPIQRKKITQVLNSGQTALFLTLTCKCYDSDDSRQRSWLLVASKLVNYIKALKRIGMVAYHLVKEATFIGGCHVHMIATFRQRFTYFEHKGKNRMTDKAFRAQLQRLWHGNVDVEVIGKDKGSKALVVEYLMKYLGKGALLENAVKWASEGCGPIKAKQRNKFIKLIYAYYYAISNRMRLWQSSVRKSEADLISSENNLDMDISERREFPPDFCVRLPFWVLRDCNISIYQRFYSKDSPQYWALLDILRSLPWLRDRSFGVTNLNTKSYVQPSQDGPTTAYTQFLLDFSETIRGAHAA